MPYNLATGNSNFTEIHNAYLHKFRPDLPQLSMQDCISYIKAIYPSTNIQSDILFAITGAEKAIGFAGLMKPANLARWYVWIQVIPGFESTGCYPLLVNGIINLAKVQNAPELIFFAYPQEEELIRLLQARKIKPISYSFHMEWKRTKKNPPIDIPDGIQIKTSEIIEDKNQFIQITKENAQVNPNLVLDSGETIESYLRECQKHYHLKHILAYHREELVGICCLKEEKTKSKNCFIENIATKSGFPSDNLRGILMAQALKIATEDGMKKTRVAITGSSQEVIEIPKKLGFRELKLQNQIIFKN